MSLLTESNANGSSGKEASVRAHHTKALFSPEMPKTASRLQKDSARSRIETLDDQYRWYIVPNAHIERRQKGKTVLLPASPQTRAHPVLAMPQFTNAPQARLRCFVRSSTRKSVIEHYQHTRCERSCRIDRNGFLDARFVWSVPESQCTTMTYSCTEPVDSYLFDEIEEYFSWLQ